MLPLLKRAATRALRSTLSDSADFLTTDDESVLSVNVEELRDLLPPLPEIPWTRVVDLYSKTVTPVYTAVQKTFCDDMEHVAQLLVDLDPPSVGDSMSLSDVEMEESIFTNSHLDSSTMTLSCSLSSARPTRGRRRSSVSDCDSTVIIPNSNPLLPTIVITPCPSLPHDHSSLVPYQDASFGNRLAVPTHPAVNNVFPPLVGKSTPLVEHWRFSNGHWWALLPSTEEQMQKGMFSRPVFTRRRRSCVEARSKYSRTRPSLSSRDT